MIILKKYDSQLIMTHFRWFLWPLMMRRLSCSVSNQTLLGVMKAERTLHFGQLKSTVKSDSSIQRNRERWNQLFGISVVESCSFPWSNTFIATRKKLIGHSVWQTSFDGFIQNVITIIQNPIEIFCFFNILWTKKTNSSTARWFIFTIFMTTSFWRWTWTFRWRRRMSFAVWPILNRRF